MEWTRRGWLASVLGALAALPLTMASPKALALPPPAKPVRKPWIGHHW